MKRTLLAFAFLGAYALLAMAQSASPAPKLGNNEAFVILNNLPIYTEDHGNLTYKDSLVIGDRVTVLSRISKFKISGNEREYLRVRSPNSAEGWARAAYIVPKSSLAVIKTDKAIIYSEPRDVKITTKTISAMTIVAVLDDGTTSSFAKIFAYDLSTDTYFTDPAVYVSMDDISSADADVNSVILYSSAMAQKSKDIRANLFKVVEKRYSSSIFFDKIKAALVPDAAAAAAAPKQTVAASGSYVLNDDNVRVRTAPDETNSQIVGKLDNGAKVEVLEATVQEYTVGGASAKWYRIKDPAGWVFGSFLVPAN